LAYLSQFRLKVRLGTTGSARSNSFAESSSSSGGGGKGFKRSGRGHAQSFKSFVANGVSLAQKSLMQVSTQS